MYVPEKVRKNLYLGYIYMLGLGLTSHLVRWLVNQLSYGHDCKYFYVYDMRPHQIISYSPPTTTTRPFLLLSQFRKPCLVQLPGCYRLSKGHPDQYWAAASAHLHFPKKISILCFFEIHAYVAAALTPPQARNFSKLQTSH